MCEQRYFHFAKTVLIVLEVRTINMKSRHCGQKIIANYIRNTLLRLISSVGEVNITVWLGRKKGINLIKGKNLTSQIKLMVRSGRQNRPDYSRHAK